MESVIAILHRPIKQSSRESPNYWCWEAPLEFLLPKWLKPAKVEIQSVLNHVQLGFKYLHRQTFHDFSGNLLLCLTTSPGIFFGISCGLICVHCLLSCQGVVLQRVWLLHLHSFPLGICGYWWDPAEPGVVHTEHSQLPQPFLLSKRIQVLFHPCDTAGLLFCHKGTLLFWYQLVTSLLSKLYG